MAEVLVTGGAGFLGRNLAAALAARGDRVTVLDDLSAGNSRLDCPELTGSQRIHCVKGSLRDEPLVRELVVSHPLVIHLASVVGVEETVSRTVATVRNLTSTLNLIARPRPMSTGRTRTSTTVRCERRTASSTRTAWSIAGSIRTSRRWRRT
jgi:UDP-glucose 4-epimerase